MELCIIHLKCGEIFFLHLETKTCYGKLPSIPYSLSPFLWPRTGFVS